jgi:hypothetical protein
LTVAPAEEEEDVGNVIFSIYRPIDHNISILTAKNIAYVLITSNTTKEKGRLVMV